MISPKQIHGAGLKHQTDRLVFDNTQTLQRKLSDMGLDGLVTQLAMDQRSIVVPFYLNHPGTEVVGEAAVVLGVETQTYIVRGDGQAQ